MLLSFLFIAEREGSNLPGRRNKDYIVIGKNRILELGSGLSATVGSNNYRGDNTESIMLSAAPVASTSWDLTGNVGTNPASNYIGTGDAQPLVVRTNTIERMRVLTNGNVGIGLTNPASTLQIEGSLAYKTSIVTATTALTALQSKIVVNNAATNITITLPDALTCIGRAYEMSRYAGSTGSITVQGSAGNRIQALGGTVGATASIGLHSATGVGLGHSFTAVNVGGVGVWVRL